jgi:hypothetical protein
LGGIDMRRLLQAVLIALLFTGSALANYYEDDKFLIGVFQGWEHLESDARLAFNHSAPSDYNPIYDFIREQYEKVSTRGSDILTKQELFEVFGEQFTPIVLVIQAKTPVLSGEIKIEHIYTENYSFETSKLRGWEFEYNHLPITYIPKYYKINIPEKHLYKTVFLVPNYVAEEIVSITIADYYGYRRSVPSKKMITAEEAKNIVRSSQVFHNSLTSYVMWWDEHFGDVKIDPSITITESSFPDGVNRWWVTTSNLNADPEVRTQVIISTYLVDKTTGQMFTYNNAEGIVLPVD